MSIASEISSKRLDLAGTRGFTAPGAGPRRRAAIDSFTRPWLQDLWVEAAGGRPLEGVALAAVGSAARRDAGPLSDLDLVLLHQGRLRGGDIDRLADAVWYPVWDAGVRLDHSVRTVAECRKVASGDLPAVVGLLDLSHIAGDPDVVAAARTAVAHDWRSAARSRLPELVESVAARHARIGEISQSLAPDLKEGHGGLRDITLLNALAEAWLTERPRGIEGAHGVLLDVRDALHVVTGKSRERLGREDQDAVAALLGYTDPDDLLADVATAGRTIAWTLQGALRRAGQSQRARTLRVGPRRPRMTPLGWGVHESDGEVVLSGSRLLESDARMPLRAAVVAARRSLSIAPQTLANLATRAPELPQPWPEDARSLFADLLASGPGLVATWESLDEAGLVERWLPEWAQVRSRPQRSPVHRHTVDRHLIETVVEAGALVREVARPDLLLLGALLHDIGKVKGAHDHSLAGAEVTERMAARLGLSGRDRDIVVRLVREHLTLIDLATRRDHADPATVAAAVDAVDADPEVLDLLLALTEADARAAGPKAWTDWRAGLLRSLGAAVHRAIDGAAREPDPEPDQVTIPAEVVAAVGAGDPHVTVEPVGGGLRVEVVDWDRQGLFADVAGLLAAHGLVVRTALLRTVDGVAADQWTVDSPTGAQPTPEQLARDLRRLATGDRGPLRALDRRRVARPAGRPGSTRALVAPGASADATVLDVRTQDRPGLLHDIGLALAGAGISVRSAHIATYAGQTLDTFYLTEQRGGPLAPARVGEVVGLLIDACDAT